MHCRSWHHSMTHNMAERVKRDEREKPAERGRVETQQKSQTIIHKNCLELITGHHYWWGENAIGLVSRQILFFHTTPTPSGCFITLSLSSSRAGPMVAALFENSSEAGAILRALTEGPWDLDRSWGLLSGAWRDLRPKTDPGCLDRKL